MTNVNKDISDGALVQLRAYIAQGDFAPNDRLPPERVLCENLGITLPFSEAADGYTDIYGVMYKPMDFDSTKVYPILQYVYPGPQTESVSKFWSTNSTEQALANLGFIVVTLGNRGGHPDRSKWYHTYSYGNLRFESPKFQGKLVTLS